MTARLPVSAVARHVDAHYHAKPNHNYCQHDSRFAAGLLKRGNEHANESQLRQHTGDELCPLQFAVVFETDSEPFSVMRQVVEVVLKFQPDVVVGRQRRFLAGGSTSPAATIRALPAVPAVALSGTSSGASCVISRPSSAAPRRVMQHGEPPWVRLRTPAVGCLHGLRPSSLPAGWNLGCRFPQDRSTNSADAELFGETSAAWSPAHRIHRMTVTTAGDQLSNGIGRQCGLGQETDHWAGRDQIGVVLLGMGGDQNHPGPR